MEGSKKFEDAALRGITRHHVWTSRIADLTVINLRDPFEVLGTQKAAAVAAPAVAEAKRPMTVPSPPPPPPPPRPTTGRQETLSALLSKLQLGRPAADSLAPPRTAQPPPPPATSPAVQTAAAPAAAPTTTTTTTTPPPLPSQPSSVAASAPPPAPTHATAVRAEEAHSPTFPDLRDSSSSGVGQFEFITGTNIPGQGIVQKPEALNEASSMALFHDPLWGGSLLDAFAAAVPARRSPKPQQRASLSELYTPSAAAAAGTTGLPAARVFGATPPTATHTPAASPSTPAVATPLPTGMTPQHLAMMGGLMAAPTPQLTTPYPMYSMPLQYVAQPQFPGGVMYNPAAFFPYGTAAMVMPQPQHLPQGYPVAPAAMMRPGTNVKAVPFVPGSTM